MLDIGFMELVVVAVVALVVLGPQKLPQAARTLGLYLGRLRAMFAGIQQEVNEQLQLEEMRARLDAHEKRVLAELQAAEKNLDQELSSVTADLQTTEPQATELQEQATTAPVNQSNPVGQQDSASQAAVASTATADTNLTLQPPKDVSK